MWTRYLLSQSLPSDLILDSSRASKMQAQLRREWCSRWLLLQKLCASRPWNTISSVSCPVTYRVVSCQRAQYRNQTFSITVLKENPSSCRSVIKASGSELAGRCEHFSSLCFARRASSVILIQQLMLHSFDLTRDFTRLKLLSLIFHPLSHLPCLPQKSKRYFSKL